MMRVLPVLLVVTSLVPAVAAQDVEYIRALERAQASRPQALTASARIAPESEPGTPLVIHGQLFAADGTSPVANAIVFAYHTDRGGLYDKPGSGPHSWRLRGWARTDATGRFEFSTIRPGSYPNTTNPAHVHFAVFTADARYHAGGLLFDDDPLIRDADRARDKALGEFASIRPVRQEGPAQHVDLRLRLDPNQRF